MSDQVAVVVVYHLTRPKEQRNSQPLPSQAGGCFTVCIEAKRIWERAVEYRTDDDGLFLECSYQHEKWCKLQSKRHMTNVFGYSTKFLPPKTLGKTQT
jgi:hypothetical protein